MCKSQISNFWVNFKLNESMTRLECQLVVNILKQKVKVTRSTYVCLLSSYAITGYVEFKKIIIQQVQIWCSLATASAHNLRQHFKVKDEDHQISAPAQNAQQLTTSSRLVTRQLIHWTTVIVWVWQQVVTSLLASPECACTYEVQKDGVERFWTLQNK